MRRVKWNVRKKLYLKIYIAVDIKSKKILSMKVTDERVHDSKALPELVVDNIIKSYSAIVGKVFTDGPYYGNDFFRCLFYRTHS